LYWDDNGSDLSRYAGGFEPGFDSPVSDFGVIAYGPEPSNAHPLVFSCQDGSYGFAGLTPGLYVIEPPDLGTCSRNNCPRRLPEALEEGQLELVTIGDSVPVLGDPVTFPERVAELFSSLADVESVNAAVSGTESSDWLPGGSYFEAARPDLDDADIVMISLGGNDVLNFAVFADLSDPLGALAEAQAIVDQIIVNIRAITAEIRDSNPDVDVVFCLYPDYSTATQTYPWSDLSVLPPGVVTNLLVRARDQITPEDELIVVDLFELTADLPAPLDDYLADELHFNDAGHDLYAHEIFRALGGVIVGDSPLASEPVSDNEQSYGYLP
jgi:lysophospholipase L1-like esterase